MGWFNLLIDHEIMNIINHLITTISTVILYVCMYVLMGNGSKFN